MVGSPVKKRKTKGEIDMAKRINIYIQEKDKNEIQILKQKYHVSLSTLCDTIANKYMFYEPLKQIINEYHIKQGTKTSIKPKNDVHYFKENESQIYTNCLYFFINRKDKEYLQNEDYVKCREVINKELQTKRDMFWQYNESIRNERRSIRENKEYWRKALETL